MSVFVMMMLGQDIAMGMGACIEVATYDPDNDSLLVDYVGDMTPDQINDAINARMRVANVRSCRWTQRVGLR